MEFREFTGKNIEDALTEASVALGITSDEIEYEVIEGGSAGLFGIFSKNAVIKARKKEAEAAEEIITEKAAPKEEPAEKKEKPKKEDPKPGENKKETVLKEEGDAAERVEAFIAQILEKMDVEGETLISTDEEEKIINVEIKGKNTSDIIGKRGQTLDAIQYLANVVANKNSEEYYKLKLDTMNYRERRQKTLENLAKNTANKVKKVKHKIALDPMNPYERRIIHAYLQPDSHIVTKSEGEEPNRRVVIYYKK